MKTIGNIIWVIFGGLEMAIAYFFIGLIWCITINVIWILFGGLELAIVEGIIGIVFCITIIGIPFGKQYFKLAKLCFMPFGAEITK